jgi:hypothetical protein
MYDDNDVSTGAPEKYTKEEFRKQQAAEEAAMKRAEAEYFKDKRTPKEGKGDLDLSGKREAMQKLREFASGQRSGASLKGGAGSGGSGGAAEIKMLQNPKAMKSGGKVSSASKRADGIATKGKTKGRIV